MNCAALIIHETKILSSRSTVHDLTPFFHGSGKDLHHGNMGFCHEKIYVLLRFFQGTIKGQQGTMVQGN